MYASPDVAPYSATLPAMMFSSALKPASGGRVEDQLGAGKTFAKVIVRFAFQLQRYTLGVECAEALAGRTDEFVVDGIFR